MANEIMRLLPKTRGYSVWVPTSRQQKGVDLVVCRLCKSTRRTATIQVKASRIYEKNGSKGYKYDTWFSIFDIAPEADFVALLWLLPPDDVSLSKSTRKRHQYSILLATRAELESFMRSCTTKSGKPESKFGFGFTDELRIQWTRGNRNVDGSNYAKWILSRRIKDLRRRLG